MNEIERIIVTQQYSYHAKAKYNFFLKNKFIIFLLVYYYRIKLKWLIYDHLNFLLEVSFHIFNAFYGQIKFPGKSTIVLNVIKVIYEVHYTVFSAIPFSSFGQQPNHTSQLIVVTGSNGLHNDSWNCK